MKFLKLAALTIPLALSAWGQTMAQPAAVSQDDNNNAVLRIGGETVTRDQITSYGMLLAQNEGYPPEGVDLLHAYILSQLHEQIPTTATVHVSTSTVSYTPYPAIGQRNYLKRELREKISSEVEVPREDLQGWYDQNVERYVQPERVRAWHIFMETSDENPTSAPATVREKLQQVKSEIDSGTSFSEAAQKYSEAASREKGGEIGAITPRQPIGPLNKPMNSELETVFFKLAPGTVSDVVETRHGMHLLYVTDKTTTVTPTVDDLVTSGILPGALAQERITSQTRQLVLDTIKRHNGQVLPGFSDSDPINDKTVVFEIAGRKTTIGDLTQVFGERFTNYVESIKQDKNEVRKLMEQGLEDEATVVAAVDKGLDKTPAASEALKNLADRTLAQKRVNAIVQAEASVSQAEVEAKYEELTDQLRQPEAAGYFVEIEVAQTTDTAEQAKARDEAMKRGEELAEMLKTADLEAVNAELTSNSQWGATVTRVPRHAINRSTETLVQQFDRAAVTIDAQVGVSRPIPLGDKLVIAKTEERWPGEPLPLSDVQDRIKAILQSEKENKVRLNLIERLQEKGAFEYLPGAADFGLQSASDEPETNTADEPTTETIPG